MAYSKFNRQKVIYYGVICYFCQNIILRNMSEKKISVLIIYTGGTIGMIQDPETGALMPFNFDHLLDNVPEL